VDGSVTELVTRGGGNWAAFNVAAGRRNGITYSPRRMLSQARSPGHRKASPLLPT